MSTDYSKLKRTHYIMPEYIEKALQKNNLMEDYKNRPAYQQNDYVGWIERAKQQKTKDKRLSQMLNELEVGGVYMKMEHKTSTKG